MFIHECSRLDLKYTCMFYKIYKLYSFEINLSYKIYVNPV